MWKKRLTPVSAEVDNIEDLLLHGVLGEGGRVVWDCQRGCRTSIGRGRGRLMTSPIAMFVPLEGSLLVLWCRGHCIRGLEPNRLQGDVTHVRHTTSI